MSRSPRASRNSISEACGNLGARPKPAVDRVIQPPQRVHRLGEHRVGDRLVRGGQARGAAQRAQDLGALLADLVRALLPRLGDRLDHRAPRRHPVARLGREVGADIERRLVGGEEGVERPPALAGHRLAGLHADGVDVGALLAVDLDADELLVHQRRHRGILEGLALHHVAPVAGRIADRDEQGPVQVAGALQRLLAPRIPVDRVVGVLEQVRRGLSGEAIGHPGEATWAPEAQYASGTGHQWLRTRSRPKEKIWLATGNR